MKTRGQYFLKYILRVCVARSNFDMCSVRVTCDDGNVRTKRMRANLCLQARLAQYLITERYLAVRLYELAPPWRLLSHAINYDISAFVK